MHNTLLEKLFSEKNNLEDDKDGLLFAAVALLNNASEGREVCYSILRTLKNAFPEALHKVEKRLSEETKKLIIEGLTDEHQ